MINRFELHRKEDETGVSGVGIVAEGVRFSDGTCALRWLTEHKSTALYNSIEDVWKIHGHGGKTRVVWYDEHPLDKVRAHARMNMVLDGAENAPFGSVGGLDARPALQVPRYIKPEHGEAFLQAYRDEARSQYGEDWATCTFSWAPAMVIGGPKEPTEFSERPTEPPSEPGELR